MKSIENYKGIISREYPNIKINRTELIEEGQNNYVILVNDEMIFRFPKNDLNKKILIREYSILKELQNVFFVEIPRPKYIFIHETAEQTFVGYPMIPGVSMNQAIFEKISDKQIIADQLAIFLRTLHSDAVFNEVGLKLIQVEVNNEWKDLYKRIENQLFQFMNETAIANTRKDFEKILNMLNDSSFNSCVVHGDFGPSNIIYDEKVGCVSGIIDFGSIEVSDPAYDIASLIGPHGYGVNFVELMKKEYPAINEYIKRALLYKNTFALQEALYGIENDDINAFESGIKEYL